MGVIVLRSLLCLLVGVLIWPQSSADLKVQDYVFDDTDEEDGGVQGRAGGEQNFGVVCSFTNWAAHRTELGKFLPEDIDPNLCTDIVYHYATLDPTTLSISARDEELDIKDNFYARVLSLKTKNPNLRVHLSVGGWSDSKDDRFTRIVSSPQNRASFIIQAVLVLQRFGFDGLDISWISPVCWQHNCQAGPPSDKENFALLLEELRAAFDNQNPPLKLSATVPATKEIIDKGYDVPRIARALDRIDVMTFDFAGHWDGKTGHQAPLHSPDGGDMKTVISSLEYWVSKGAPKEKLFMGVPAYGRTFTLEDPSNPGIGSPSNKPGKQGEYFGEEGRLAFYEICERINKRGWVEKEDKKSVENYAYKGDQWVSFDNPILAAKKAKYVRKKGYGGIFLWDITADDFRGSCCLIKYPLLSSINFILRGTGAHPEKLGCKSSAVTPVRELDDPSKANDFRIVCSFTSWAGYRHGQNRYLPEDVDAELCTDVVYDYALLDADSLLMVTKDVRTDIDDEFYKRILKLKSRNPSLRVYLSLGGWADSEGDKYSRLVSNPAARRKFIVNAIKYLKEHRFDGLDVAWMFPVCWQTQCDAGRREDRENFATFIEELREAFDQQNPRLFLSVTISGARDILNRAYDIPRLAKAVDRIDVMTYDFAGHWFGRTGHHAPLHVPAGTRSPRWSVNTAIQLLLRKGAPANKISLGIPTYGIGFTLPSTVDHKVGARTIGPSKGSSVFTTEEGRYAFFEICDKVKRGGWTKISDPALGPYAYKGDQWVGYDDVESAATKAKYIKQHKLAGATIWDVTLDDFNAQCCDVKNPLLNSVSYVLKGKGVSPNTAGCEPPGIIATQNPQLDPRRP